MNMIQLLREAQAEILMLQQRLAMLQPRATAFDLLVRTHLGRTDGGNLVSADRSVLNEISYAVEQLQREVAADAEEAAAKEAAKAAKTKKPRKPRAPKVSEPAGGEPQGGAQQTDEPDPGASPPESRRRRGLFAVPGTQQ